MIPERMTTNRIHDNRGWFMEAMHGLAQVNMSYSKKGVLRGMHYQTKPYAQSKKIIVLDGLIEDVVVDLRTKQVYSFIMKKHDGLYVPSHYAHGFRALEDSRIMYGVDNVWDKSSERIIKFDTIGYDWGTTKNIVSDKDLNGTRLEDLL